MKNKSIIIVSALLVVSLCFNVYLFRCLSEQTALHSEMNTKYIDLSATLEDMKTHISDIESTVSTLQQENEKLKQENKELQQENEKQLTSGIDFTFEPTEEMEAMRKEMEEKASSSSASSKGGSESSKVESSSKASSQSSSIGDWGATKRPAGGKGQYGHGDENAAAGTPDGNILAD